MKRLGLILLSLAMIVTMGACSGKSAFELYNTATKAANDADSMDYNMSMDISMTMDGETMDMAVKAAAKQIMLSETDAELEMEMDISMYGMTINTSVYYIDGYAYMDMMGQKIKTEVPISDVLSQAGGDNFMAFDESAIITDEVEKADGSTTVRFTIDSDSLTEYLEEQIAGMFQSIAELDPEYDFGDIDVETVIDSKGNLKSQKLSYAYEITVMGETAEAQADMLIEINALGGVTIEAPDDLDSYTDIGAGGASIF